MKKAKREPWPFPGLTALVAESESHKWHLDSLLRSHARALVQNMRHDEATKALRACSELTTTNCGWSEYQAAQRLAEAIAEAWPTLSPTPRREGAR